MKIFPFSLLFCLAASVPGVAQDKQPSWQAVRDRQPAGLHLRLTLPKTHFHIGEVITATLSFAHDEKEDWHFSGPTGGRSGRVTDVAFRATGQDGALVPDPLEWYFKNYLSMSGGGGTQKRLGPWEFRLAANQWLQFEKPGTYQLYAWSACLTPGKPVQPYEKHAPPVELVSDPVTISIDPLTAEEEKSIIEEATQALRSPPQPGFDDPVFEAMQRLRFLQTPAARDAILPFVDGPYNQEAELAFYGRPDYAASAAHILALVREGRLGLSVALLNFYSGLKSGGMMAFEFGAKGQQPRLDAHEELFAAARRVIESDGKSGAFFADLLAWFRRDPREPAIRSLLIQRQLELPQKQIDEVFGAQIWKSREKDLLVEKDFLPLIRELARPEKHNLNALKALAALAPEEARPIVVEDIRSNRPVYIPSAHEYAPNIDLQAFGALPDRELPELDPVLRERLLRDPIDGPGLEGTMLLIDRFATKALLPDVVRIYQTGEGHWQCVLQGAVLRYWIRCNPKAGVEALGRALQRNHPGETGCFRMVLGGVLEKAWVDEALPVVLAATGNGDAEVIRSATKLLEAHAGPEAIESVIAAIERAAAQPLPDDASSRHNLLNFPVGLTNFLLNSKRWTLNRPQLERLLKVATDPTLQSRLKSALAGSEK